MHEFAFYIELSMVSKWICNSGSSMTWRAGSPFTGSPPRKPSTSSARSLRSVQNIFFLTFFLRSINIMLLIFLSLKMMKRCPAVSIQFSWTGNETKPHIRTWNRYSLKLRTICVFSTIKLRRFFYRWRLAPTEPPTSTPAMAVPSGEQNKRIL